MPKPFKGPLLSACLLLAVIVLILPSFSSLTRFGSTEQTDPYEQFSAEVLLNRGDIEYDIDLLNEYVEDGQMDLYEVGAPELIVQEAGVEEETPSEEDDELDFPYGDYYLYSSHGDPDITVVLTEIDDTMKAEPFFPGISLKGLSVSLVVPSKMEMFQNEVKRAKADLGSPLSLNETVGYFMESRGYFTFHMRDTEGIHFGYGIINGTTEIYIFNRTSNETSWSGLETGIVAVLDKDTPVDTVDRDIRDLLDELGLNSTVWTGTYGTGFREEERLVADIEGGLGSLDWRALMSSELDWLVEHEIVDGLTQEDIADISDLSGSGVSGINNRIIFDDGAWKTFDEIGTIPTLGGGFEQTGANSRYNLGKEPRPVPTGLKRDRQDIRPIIVLIGSIILVLIIVSILLSLYARHKRNELLENMNRKHLIDIIKEKPGIHFSELQRELDLKQGVLSYHLNVLEKNELIKSVQDGTFRRFYLYDDKIEFEFRLHEMQKNILFIISQRPGITQSNISKKLGRNRMVVNYHLKILLETGILHMEREGRETHCYLTDAGYHWAGA
ncbi:MAG: winged helix-turn-helix transcriptional regulator [Thermoplasmatota archaeon]